MALRLKAKKSEKPVYAFIRKGNSLVPEMDMDLAALDGIAQGERVRVDLKQWRNSGRLRAYWAMIGEVVAATGCASSSEKLHELIKLQTGHIELVRLGNGLTVAIPGSIAFDKIDEQEMVRFFASAQEFLAREYGYVGKEAA